jgi:hypothetical protein
MEVQAFGLRPIAAPENDGRRMRPRGAADAGPLRVPRHPPHRGCRQQDEREKSAKAPSSDAARRHLAEAPPHAAW